MLHNVIVLYQRTAHIQLYSVDQLECRLRNPIDRIEAEAAEAARRAREEAEAAEAAAVEVGRRQARPWLESTTTRFHQTLIVKRKHSAFNLNPCLSE